MFRKMGLVLTLFGIIAAMPLNAGDLLKELLRNVETQAKTQIRQRVESPGEVTDIDRSINPSVIVRTSDGRVFQLRSVEIIASPTLDPYLGMAQSLDFTQESGHRYDIRVHFRELSASSNSLVSNILSSAMNDTMRSDKVSRTTADIQGLAGQTLDGRSWLLDVGRSPLETIEFLN